jgi:hypothetical protein
MSIIQDISDPNTEDISDDTLPMEMDQSESTNNDQNVPDSTINNQNIINEIEDQILGDIPISPLGTPKIPGCPPNDSDNDDPPILS